MSSTFVPDDYEKPIKYFYEDFWISLVKDRTVISKVALQKKEITLSDDIFGIFSAIKNDYYYQRSHMEYSTADLKNEEIGDSILFI